MKHPCHTLSQKGATVCVSVGVKECWQVITELGKQKQAIVMNKKPQTLCIDSFTSIFQSYLTWLNYISPDKRRNCAFPAHKLEL